jgi:hypothetical protein
MMRAGLRRPAIPPNSSCAASFPQNARPDAAIFSILLHCTEPLEATGVFYRGTGPQDKIPASIRNFPNRRSGDSSMVITSAHIQPIVALIAGILILIMPRFLNLVVAIYLIFIGLAGLGLLDWLHK